MRRLVFALVFVLIAPAVSAQTAAPAPEKKAAPPPAEPAPAPKAAAEAAAPAPQPAAPAVVPAAAETTQPDVQPARAKKRKSQEAKAQGEQAMQQLGLQLPKGAPDLSPKEQKKLAEDVVKGMTDSNRDLLDQTLPPPPSREQVLEELARGFFFSVMSGDARSIAMNSALPFTLEDRRISSEQELFEQWLHHLRSKRTDLLVLYGVEVLTPEQMEKKYGAPPPRLQGLPWRSGKTFIAVGNLSGHAAIALFRETRPGEYQLVGYTD